MDTSRAGEPARYCRAGFFNICMQSFFLLSENSIFADRFCEDV